MPPEEQDILAALLKSTWEHGLIPEPIYRAALNRLYSSKTEGAPRHGYPQSTR